MSKSFSSFGKLYISCHSSLKGPCYYGLELIIKHRFLKIVNRSIPIALIMNVAYFTTFNVWEHSAVLYSLAGVFVWSGAKILLSANWKYLTNFRSYLQIEIVLIIDNLQFLSFSYILTPFYKNDLFQMSYFLLSNEAYLLNLLLHWYLNCRSHMLEVVFIVLLDSHCINHRERYDFKANTQMLKSCSVICHLSWNHSSKNNFNPKKTKTSTTARLTKSRDRFH
jgi:hypothetical protein